MNKKDESGIVSGIFRVVKDEKYSTISNEVICDKRVSWETRAVIIYLLSKPNNWTMRIANLLKQGNAKRDKLKRMLREAITFGYMVRIRIQHEDKKFSWVTQVYESSSLNPYFPCVGFVKVVIPSQKTSDGKSTTGSIPAEKPVTGLPLVAHPLTGSATSGKPVDIVITEGLSITEEEKTESSSPITEAGEGGGDSIFSEEQKTIAAYLQNLNLLFPPERFGHLEIRPAFLGCNSLDVLGWITKAYQDRESLMRGGGAIGLIVSRLNSMTPADSYYTANATDILPVDYLEAAGLYRSVCQYCDYVARTRDEINAHLLTDHRVECEECGDVFLNKHDERQHYSEEHDPERVILTHPAPSKVLDSIWEGVLLKLQDEMPKASFDTWVRDSRPISLAGGVLTVSVRNAYAQDWLSSRLQNTVAKILKDKTVEFVVKA